MARASPAAAREMLAVVWRAVINKVKTSAGRPGTIWSRARRCSFRPGDASTALATRRDGIAIACTGIGSSLRDCRPSFSSSFRNCSTRRTTRARRPSPCARLMVTAFCPAATSVADAALVWMRVCPSRASCYHDCRRAAHDRERCAERLGECAMPHDRGLRAKAIPRECSATADAERRYRRRLASEHANCLGVIDHETPAGVGGKTRKRGLTAPAGRRTGRGRRPRSAAVARRASRSVARAVPAQSDHDEESLDRNSIDCRAIRAPARDRIRCPVEQDQRALWALRPGNKKNPETGCNVDGYRRPASPPMSRVNSCATTLGHQPTLRARLDDQGSMLPGGARRSDGLDPRYSAEVKSGMAHPRHWTSLTLL